MDTEGVNVLGHLGESVSGCKLNPEMARDEFGDLFVDCLRWGMTNQLGADST